MLNRLRYYWSVLAVALVGIAVALTWWLTPRPVHFELAAHHAARWPFVGEIN